METSITIQQHILNSRGEVLAGEPRPLLMNHSITGKWAEEFGKVTQVARGH
jgi:hypothetical protein